MDALPILKKIMKQKLEEDPSLSDQNISHLLKDILNSLAFEVVKKIKLPEPPTEIQAKIFELREKRLSDGYKQRHKEFNYELWNSVSKLKNIINSVPISASFPHKRLASDSSNLQVNYSKDGDSIGIDNHVSGSSIAKNALHNFVLFKIESKLEDEMLKDKTLSKFVSVIEQSCRQGLDEVDHDSEFYLHKNLDQEIIKWERLLLDVKFPTSNFDAKIQKWELLRNVIDKEIDVLLNQLDSESEKLKQISKNFYIKLVE